MSKNICKECGRTSDIVDMKNCPFCHTTTQKKEVALEDAMPTDYLLPTTPNHIDDVPRREFAGASYVSEVAPTPSINEIIKELEMGGEIIDYEGDLRPNGIDKLKSFITTFEVNIRADEREKVRKEVWHERNSLVYEAHEGYKKLIPSLLEDARQSIYKELIDAIEGEKAKWKPGRLVTNARRSGLNDATQIIKQKYEN